jgi:hypothetical protein
MSYYFKTVYREWLPAGHYWIYAGLVHNDGKLKYTWFFYRMQRRRIVSYQTRTARKHTGRAPRPEPKRLIFHVGPFSGKLSH